MHLGSTKVQGGAIAAAVVGAVLVILFVIIIIIMAITILCKEFLLKSLKVPLLINALQKPCTLHILGGIISITIALLFFSL